MKIYIFFNVILEILNTCNNFDNYYYCNSELKNSYPEEWDNRCFQTPPRNDTLGNYRETFQDMNYLVGYTQLIYSKDRSSCTINFITKVNPILGNEGIDYKIKYKFGEIEQDNNNITINSKISYPNGFPISAKLLDINSENIIAKLELENEYFLWDNVKVNQNMKYENGQKGVIVELFGWPYDDIAEECEFLSVAGYMGVKIFPPNEAILTYDIVEDGELNPWWYFYQSVSYKLESRLGNKINLKKMINKCRLYNIRIYSEVIINQMVGNGNDMYNYHLNSDCSTYGAKTGSAGSPFWTTRARNENNSYTNQIPVLEFPAVPYFSSDFHCQQEITNYYDSEQLNAGWVGGDLIDLNTEKEYVQQRIADFLTELISLGISGISINNAKHISPTDFSQIFKRLKDNLGGGDLPDDFIAILEITFGGEKSILFCNEGKYSFAEKFIEKLKNIEFSEEDINKIKITNEDFRENKPVCNEKWKISQNRYVIYYENQNIQKVDAAFSYSYIYTKDIESHRNEYVNYMRETKIDYKIKFIFSSYSLINGANGFPDGKSDCSKCKTKDCQNSCTKSVPYQKAYEPLSTGYDTGNSTNWIEGGYTRVHRDLDIVNSMREWMGMDAFSENNLYKNERKKVYNFTDEETDIQMEECSAIEYLNNTCKIKNNLTQITNKILKDIESQIINGNINDILLGVIDNEKKDIIIKEENTLLEITSSFNQNNKQYSNISTIELGECENILKSKYNISEDETLIILKLEIYKKGLYIPIIEYQLFHPFTKEKLNLSYCSNTTINLYIPAEIDENSLLKHNSTSEYYTDKCLPSTSINGVDIILEDRKNEFINNNMSLCENNCEYDGYDIKKKKVICQCGIKSKFNYFKDLNNIDSSILLSKFKDLKNEINLFVLSCYETLFTKDGLSGNIGSYALFFIILYFIGSLNFFVIFGYKYFKKKVTQLITEKSKNMSKDNKIVNYEININQNQENINIFNINNLDIEKSNRIETIEKIKKDINDIKQPPKRRNLSKSKTIFDISNNSHNSLELPKVKKDNSNSKFKLDLSSEKRKVANNILLISSNTKNPNFISDNKNFMNYNDYELNSFSYENALKIDKRTYCEYYKSLLKTKHLLIFTFFNHNDYNSKTIKICLFFFSFALFYTVNALFFTESEIHKIYEDEGEYKFIYQIPQIIISTIISSILRIIINYFSLSEKSILEIKHEKNLENIEYKLPDVFNCLIIKFTIFFELSLIILIFFWYYLSCFCAVYKNTQLFLIKDTIICFILALLYPLFINLLPGIFRIPSLANRNRRIMYKFSRLVELL